MAAEWTEPCYFLDQGDGCFEEAWCGSHLAELLGKQQNILSAKITNAGGYVDADGRRGECDKNQRGRVIPMGTILMLGLDLDEVRA